MPPNGTGMCPNQPVKTPRLLSALGLAPCCAEVYELCTLLLPHIAAYVFMNIFNTVAREQASVEILSYVI